MTKKEFREKFKRGLGSAIIELNCCDDPIKYRDIVLDCCLHNTCYDMQCEGERSAYLYEAIQIIGPKYFEQELIKKFNKGYDDGWLHYQLAHLLCIFYENGSEDAKVALNNRFEQLFTKLSAMKKYPNRIRNDGFETLCIVITAVDFNFFESVVERVGKHLADEIGSDVFSLDWYYSNTINRYGKKNVERVLKKVNQEYAAAFKKEFDSSFSANSKREQVGLPSVNDILSYAYSNEDEKPYARYKFRKFAKNASQEQLIEIAEKAILEEEPKVLEKLLFIFKIVAFPLSHDYVFKWSNSEDLNIKTMAFEMMEEIISDDIHDLAVKLLSENQQVENAIYMLIKNYSKSDETLLFESIKKLNVKDDGWHSIFMMVEDVYRKNLWKPKTDILVYMYETSLCSYCRKDIVETMSKCRVITQLLLNECLYDCNLDLRDYVARKIKSISTRK